MVHVMLLPLFLYKVPVDLGKFLWYVANVATVPLDSYSQVIMCDFTASAPHCVCGGVQVETNRIFECNSPPHFILNVVFKMGGCIIG